eukprot:TRINITY_DN67179_c10_g3_i1.p1 TRINITY_DN67179_c10_g3~~TRINITY_DN67179_c10_g3_i1.p1  ORF type:complete len:594 (+),score=44.00 TRINITY_DN67179_c10_g3_i1:124-1782(+)
MIPAKLTKKHPRTTEEADKRLLKEFVCVRMRGLPYKADEQDVREFMDGLQIAEGTESIQFLHNFTGRSKGEAFVKFANHEEAEKALERNRNYIGDRWIELFPANEVEMAHCSHPAIANGCTVLKMRGLPWSASETEIREFFSGITLSQSAVKVLYFPDGRSTGEAFVTFNSEEDALQAVKRHKNPMGTRYVELFPSSAEEIQTATTAVSYDEYLKREIIRKRQHLDRLRVQEAEYYRLYGTFPSSHSSYNKKQQESNTNQPNADVSSLMGSTLTLDDEDPPPSTNVVKLRGLPFSCNELDIATFFAGLNILQRGIHMVYNSNDKPTGQAFVEFKFDSDVKAALLKNKSKMGHRWVEVFQSSHEELQQAYGLSEMQKMLTHTGEYCGDPSREEKPPAWFAAGGDEFNNTQFRGNPRGPRHNNRPRGGHRRQRGSQQNTYQQQGGVDMYGWGGGWQQPMGDPMAYNDGYGTGMYPDGAWYYEADGTGPYPCDAAGGQPVPIAYPYADPIHGMMYVPQADPTVGGYWDSQQVPPGSPQPDLTGNAQPPSIPETCM